MNAKQLASLAARIERARREVSAISAALEAVPLDGVGIRTRHDIEDIGFCVPRLKACEERLWHMAAQAKKDDRAA